MDLASYCQTLSDASKDASQWVERNSDLVRNEKDGLLKDLRKAGRTFRSCAKAAKRKMCAGVFGPSQAGKSYLISALARGANDELAAKFADETRDFISEINPVGGKESTGLVTRFTLTKPQNLPQGYPVQLRLLSETDLVKILANAYYADCEHKDLPKSDIQATLTSLKVRATNTPGRIDLDVLEDLREYLLKDFGSKARVQQLEHSYWDTALSIGPKLDLEGRIQLYALIWDEVEEFTTLLRKLLQTLEKLDFPDQLYCAMDALLPRESSIIDVATLSGLEGNETGPDLSICTPEGIKATIPRSIVTALTAELNISMVDKPADYFEHTDLLDFPGYRSRYKLVDLRHELKKEGMLKELFLRGKVAYLFQRYCAERELNSMLLCIGPSNQEVQDLPGVINDWVCATHGETPEEREGRDVSLFFILTKFDMEFEDKKGAASVEARWDTRLHASLLDFFGKQYDWPTQWTEKKGFDNIFMLRNPNFKFDAVIDYNSNDKETGIRPEKIPFVEKLHHSFLMSPEVKAHFRNPGKAWDEAMRLNDGGISYIRESLSPLCNPMLKERQLLQNIETCRENIQRRLKSFYQTDDRQELRKQKTKLALSLFSKLGNLELKYHRLGALLRDFAVSDSYIYDLHSEAMHRYQEMLDQEEHAPAPEDTTLDLDNIDLDNFDLAAYNRLDTSQAGKSADPVKEDPTMQDEAAFYASFIESKWVENLHKLADDPVAQKFYKLNGHEFSALASELATGVSRLGLKDSLAESFRKARDFSDTKKDGILGRQAAIAARTLNDYVDWLGFNPRNLSEKERSIQLLASAPVTVFQPHAKIDDLPPVKERSEEKNKEEANKTTYEEPEFTRNWFSDWTYALAGLILTNVNYDGNQIINDVENRALGSILKKMSKETENIDQKNVLKNENSAHGKGIVLDK